MYLETVNYFHIYKNVLSADPLIDGPNISGVSKEHRPLTGNNALLAKHDLFIGHSSTCANLGVSN